MRGVEEWGDGVGGGAAARAPTGNGRFLLRQLPKVRRLKDLLILAVWVYGVGCAMSMSTMRRGKQERVAHLEGGFFPNQHGFHNLDSFYFFIGEPKMDVPL